MTRMKRNGNQAKLSTVVFDFDGTLAELKLDFTEMKHRLCEMMARDFGLDAGIPSIPVLEWIEELSRQMEHTDGNTATAKKLRFAAMDLIVNMEVESSREGRLFPFTRPLLDRLTRRGVKTAIITRNCEKAVRGVFPDLDDYCPILLTRDHVPKVKPDPDHLMRALARCRSMPESSIMVGDHPFDIETGKRAGAYTAGVSTGKVTECDLASSGAHWTAQDCRQLVDILMQDEWI